MLSTLPAALSSTNGFLAQADTVLRDLAPYRQYIDDTFLGLGTSFTDMDVGAQGQPLTGSDGKPLFPGARGEHFWSVYSVTCTPAGYGTCQGDAPASYTPGDPGNVWAAFAFGGGSK